MAMNQASTVVYSCGNCSIVTFDVQEIRDHFTLTGHKKRGFIRTSVRVLLEAQIYLIILVVGLPLTLAAVALLYFVGTYLVAFPLLVAVAILLWRMFRR